MQALNNFVRKSVLIIICIISSFQLLSQTPPKRIGVIGSSTAYGYFGATGIPRDSAWAFKVSKYYKDLGVIDTLYNIAVNGQDCYHVMPSSYIPPVGRPAPNPLYNITRVINFIPKPDVIIVNLPSNGYPDYSISEILYCLQTIKDSANANGIDCYITTTQPRDDYNAVLRVKLRDIKIAIENTFGPWAIDFYTELTDPVDLGLKTMYELGDNVHINPAGHTVLKNAVIAKSMFFGPVASTFTSVNAIQLSGKVLVTWKVANEINNSRFDIQRSFNGSDFTTIGTIAGTNGGQTVYNYIDNDISNNTSYYRVKAIDFAGAVTISQIIKVDSHAKKDGGFIFPTITTGKLSLVLPDNFSGAGYISISDIAGKTLEYRKMIASPSEVYEISVEHLIPGSYILNTYLNDKRTAYRFFRR